MPVKLGSELAPESAEARIEIIPLIDIMFFLLAAFMLVSLSMVNLKSMKVNLPTATTATPETKKDFVDISVDKNGSVFLDKAPIAHHELTLTLARLHKTNPDLRVFISGDQRALHGDIIQVLDAVRSAGIDKVAFEIRAGEGIPEAMNRIVQVVNSIGILALAALCCVQWQANRRVNLEAIRLERARTEQEAKLAAQDQMIRGDAADLADFRRRLTLLASDLKDAQDKLAASDTQSSHLTAQCDHLTAERDQLKSALDKWVAAVASRDEALRKAGAQVQSLAAERNDAIKKFNDLVGKYNALVKNLADAATRP